MAKAARKATKKKATKRRRRSRTAQPKKADTTPSPHELAAAAERQQAQAAFLEAFVEKHTVYHAAQASKVGRRTHYDWLTNDPAYAVAFDDAKEAVIDILTNEADRRGAEGVLEPVYYQGEKVDSVRKYSDVLLIFRLKALAPDLYRERFEHSGPGGGPIHTTFTLKLDGPDRHI